MIANDDRRPSPLQWLLRAEALGVLAVAVVLYAAGDHGWGTFAALFLVPDLALLGYLAGPRAGAIAYNTVHSYLGPLALAALALSGVAPAVLPYALIWTAHCALDRALGYGLKARAGFQFTHLGMIGRRAPAAA
jgi:hypothetical protein